MQLWFIKKHLVDLILAVYVLFPFFFLVGLLGCYFCSGGSYRSRGFLCGYCGHTEPTLNSDRRSLVAFFRWFPASPNGRDNFVILWCGWVCSSFWFIIYFIFLLPRLRNAHLFLFQMWSALRGPMSSSASCTTAKAVSLCTASSLRRLR